MTTTDKIVKGLDEAKSRFNQTLGIKTLALFGSFARGDQTDESDIDVLVEMSKPSFDGYMESEILPRRQIQNESGSCS